MRMVIVRQTHTRLGQGQPRPMCKVTPPAAPFLCAPKPVSGGPRVRVSLLRVSEMTCHHVRHAAPVEVDGLGRESTLLSIFNICTNSNTYMDLQLLVVVYFRK
jgi:hypothetical protein